MKLVSFILFLLLVAKSQTAKSQTISCENLKTIINTIRLHNEVITGKKRNEIDTSGSRYESKVKLNKNNNASILTVAGSKNANQYIEYLAEGVTMEKANIVFVSYFHELQLCEQTREIKILTTFQTEKKAYAYYHEANINLVMRKQSLSSNYSVTLEINYVQYDDGNWDFIEEK